MPSPRSIATRAGLAVASLVLGGFLVLGFKAPDEVTTSGSSSTDPGTGSTNTTTSGSATTGSTATTGPATTGSTGSTGGSQTVTGSIVTTRYGPVQVEVTVSDGKIVSIAAVELPAGGRSGMISAYAAPILTDEALAAQSAQIDLVSGATYTSTAYERSLQAALDQVGA
jgi:uncharacterized protein with FMN-binding domain